MYRTVRFSCGFEEASQIIVPYSIPIGVKRIGITMLACASPRGQSSRPEDAPLGSEIDDRLADVEDALEADTKPTDLSTSSALAPPMA